MRTYPKGSGGFRTTFLYKIKSSCDHHTRIRKNGKENDEHKDRTKNEKYCAREEKPVGSSERTR